jgi:transcriptional regulator with XRE-family HTH domain
MTRTRPREDDDLATRRARLAHAIRSLRRVRFRSRAAFYAAAPPAASRSGFLTRLEDPAGGDHGLASLVALAQALDVSTRCLIGPYFAGDPPFRAAESGGPAALGGELRRLRRARGLSSVEAAAIAGVHPNYLTGIERGAVRSPRLVTLVRAATPLADSDEMLAAVVERLVEIYAGECAPPAPPPPRRRRRSDAARSRGLPSVT